jgi:hypothetical protein
MTMDAIIASLFGGASLATAIWSARVALRSDSSAMGCMTVIMLMMVVWFGSAAIHAIAITP